VFVSYLYRTKQVEQESRAIAGKPCNAAVNFEYGVWGLHGQPPKTGGWPCKRFDRTRKNDGA